MTGKREKEIKDKYNGTKISIDEYSSLKGM